MTRAKKEILPALHDSGKVKQPDLQELGNNNYTSTILRYGNLAVRFPQLETDAKQVVPAINEVRVIANPPIDTKNYLLTDDSGEYLITTEDDYAIEVGGESSNPVLHSIQIKGVIYRIVGDGGAKDLDDLTDVTIQNPENGQILVYNSYTHQWENQDSSGGGDYTAGYGIYFTGDNNSIINADAGRKSRGKNVLTFQTEYHWDESDSYDWQDTGTTIDDNIVYQSLAGTYQQSSGNSIGTYTVSGATKFTVHLKQNVEDSRYSYVVLGKPNTPIDLSTEDYEKSYCGESIPDYVEYEYTGLNPYGGTSTIQVMFHKEEPPPPVPIGVTVDLNNDQWRDAKTTVAGNEVYESNQGSWHIDNGASVCTIYINGVTSISIYVSQSSEYNYDYCYIGNIDEPVSKSNYRNTTYGLYTGYITFTYECTPDQHYIQLMYAKDGSLWEGEDRGYFYYVVNSMDESQEVDDTPVANGDSSTDRAWIYGESSEPYLGEHGEVFNDYDNNYATGNYAHAEGSHTTASGGYSHAEGTGTCAYDYNSHAEGSYTISGYNSHAEGESSIASAEASHAEGHQTQAIDKFAHAEGYMNIASAQCAHAEGNNTIASGENSHTEGRQTQATNVRAHAEGGFTLASGEASHAEGHYTVASGTNSHAEGYYSKATNPYTHAEGYETEAIGDSAHSEGYKTLAGGHGSHAEGYGYSDFDLGSGPVTASGKGSHAEGTKTTASGNFSHAEGVFNTASGIGAHAEGMPNGGGANIASGNGSHAEGSGSKASGHFSHAEGAQSAAIGLESHAEGGGTKAYGDRAHSEGAGTKAYGSKSHVEGAGTETFGVFSHVEGAGNVILGNYGHMEGAGNASTGSAYNTHTEGGGNYNYSAQGHIEGSGNIISGEETHGEGAGNQAHGPKNHSEGGGNAVYGIGSHVEGKHNSIAGFAVHAEGSDNLIGSLTSISRFDYGTNYSVGDIVGPNADYVNFGESSSQYLYRCITAPGKIQGGNGVEFITASSWSSSTNYPANSVVYFWAQKGCGYYYCSSAVSAQDVPPPVDGSGWTRITALLSPFKSGTYSGYYLIRADQELYSGISVAKVASDTSIAAMWEPISTPHSSHVEGLGNISTGNYQHVQGKFNVADSTKAFIIGNGTADNSRSNALTVDWSGNTTIAGDLTTGVQLSTTAQSIGAAINELAAGGGSSVNPIPDSFIYSLFS